MKNSSAAAEAQDTRRRRRFPRKTAIGIVTLGLVAFAGVAFALYLLSAKVTGSATTDSANYQWGLVSGSTHTLTGTGTAKTCAPTYSGSGNGNALNLVVEGYPGDTCVVTSDFGLVGASESFRLTGVTLTGLPTGWTAQLSGGSCGKTIGASSPDTVQFTVTVGSSGAGTIAGGLALSPVSQVGTGILTCTGTGS